MTSNKKVLAFVEESKNLCQPDQIVWIDGSEAQLDALRAEAVATGELIKLNEELLPGCYLHRTAVNDVARVEDRTFICTKDRDSSSPINNWMDSDEAYAMLKELYRGAMKGRTMYVIPYSHGAGRFALLQDRHRADRLHLRRAEHGDHDPRGHERPATRWATRRLRHAACTPSADIDAEQPLHRATSRRTTPSGPSTPATAATCCWAKSALRCASLPIRARTRAGWPSTC